MHEVELEFVERMGLMSEQDGLPRIAGRIFGLLLLQDGPFSLDDLTERLQVSKTSASTNARLLEGMGFIVRTSKPGDRRDFYRMAPDAPERSFEQVRVRMVRTLDALDSTIRRLPAGKKVERERLKEMRDWHAFLLEELDRTLTRWKERQDGIGSTLEGNEDEGAT